MSDKDSDVTGQLGSNPDGQPNDRGQSLLDSSKDPAVTSTKATADSSAPIEIRQAASGKFGVLNVRQPSPSQLMTDSNGEPISIDKLIKTANTMSSMMMAHKIALEDDFKLEPGMDISGPLMSLSPIIGSSPTGAGSGPSGEPSLHSRVKDIVHEAYWDLFRDEIKSQSSEIEEERKFEQSKQLICDIKQKIIELLLPQHARLKQDIEDKLDAQMIDQLTRCDSFSLLDYGKYILSVLAKLCAPVRDEKLKELSQLDDIVLLYRGIMELLEMMRLDLANFTLNRFKPHIKAHSHDYERDKFNEILKQQKSIGIDGLEYTRIWLDRAVKRVDSVHGVADLIANHNEPMSTSSVGIEESTFKDEASDTKLNKILRSEVLNKTLNVAYCELLEWSPQTQKLYPETLLFDEGTFKSLGDQYKVLLLTSSILLTTFAFLKGFKLHEDNYFKVLIKSHIITLLTASYERQPSTNLANNEQVSTSSGGSSGKLLAPIDQVKLETVSAKLCEDIKQRITETDSTLLDKFEEQKELLKRQILDLESSSNRIRELARRRIIEFAETLLELDFKHQQKMFSSRMPPPVNIPLGLNCLTDEITLTMAQVVKIVRYNRKVFYQHYQDIIVDIVAKLI